MSPSLHRPPPIPGAEAGLDERPGHALVWVRTGTAHVRVSDAVTLHLAAGEGVWIPSTEEGSHRGIVTEPGTVAFPLRLTPAAGAPSEPIRFAVPAGWQDWLIQHFNLSVTPLAGRGYSHDLLVDLLRHAGPPAPPETVLLPRSSGARAVAEELLRDPALALTVEQWATRVPSSARSLRRDFLADTQLTFEQWRLRCRLNAAVELLVAGYGVDQVAARVGFASHNGLTRAFKQQFGATPHRFRREASTQPVTLSGRAAAARQADDLVDLVRGGRVPPALLPRASTPPHTNQVHVLSWVYRGSGYLDIGDDRFERRRGSATWIPADVEHVTGLRDDSISLPLGNADPGDLSLTEPLQVQFSPAWDDFLMSCSVSSRSRLRPHDHSPARVLDLFQEQVAAQRAQSVPMPTDPRARAAATDYLRRIEAAGRSYDVAADVNRAFREQTGMTFARWCYAARMRIARDLLVGGAKPSAVARRVGYAHLPNFSAAFARFHGVAPREFQERATGQASPAR